MKRLLGLSGATAGVGVPAWSFFTSYPPPLFPGITWITAALSLAIWVISSKRSNKQGTAKWRIITAVGLLIFYIALLQFTTLPIPPENKNRVQIGFGTAQWTLTKDGQKWKTTHPAITAYEIADRESAFVQDRVTIAWEIWSVYSAGICLILFYFAGFGLWTSGFALLGIGKPD